MIKKFKTSSPQVKTLLGNLNTVPKGGTFDIEPLMPALSLEPIQATVVEKEDNFWTLYCTWHGVSIGDLQVEIADGQVILEDV